MSAGNFDRNRSPTPVPFHRHAQPSGNEVNSMPALRSQMEFLMVGVVPVGPQTGEDCTVCTEPLVDDVVRMCACSHHFHCTCILTWFQGSDNQNRTCPNCRRELYEAAPQRLRFDNLSLDDEEPGVWLPPVYDFETDDEHVPTGESSTGGSSVLTLLAPRSNASSSGLSFFGPAPSPPPPPLREHFHAGHSFFSPLPLDSDSEDDEDDIARRGRRVSTNVLAGTGQRVSPSIITGTLTGQPVNTTGMQARRHTPRGFSAIAQRVSVAVMRARRHTARPHPAVNAVAGRRQHASTVGSQARRHTLRPRALSTSSSSSQSGIEDDEQMSYPYPRTTAAGTNRRSRARPLLSEAAITEDEGAIDEDEGDIDEDEGAIDEAEGDVGEAEGDVGEAVGDMDELERLVGVVERLRAEAQALRHDQSRT